MERLAERNSVYRVPRNAGELLADEYVAGTDQLNMEALYEPFLTQVPRGSAILDAGCGRDATSRRFWNVAYRVTAVDASATHDRTFHTKNTGDRQPPLGKTRR